MCLPAASPSPLPACSCDASIRGKSGTVVLTGATNLNDPYAVCYTQFTVAVDNNCALTLTPAAFSAELKYKNTVSGQRMGCLPVPAAWWAASGSSGGVCVCNGAALPMCLLVCLQPAPPVSSSTTTLPTSTHPPC